MSERVGPTSKAARQGRIVDLLTHEPVRSQTELAERLGADGFAVSQGTLSRDLADLGALRVRTPAGE
ncbi:MAG: arginine repressor, partial [Propionibacteriaceae bacterium]|nr:arginine repressor [Propionibacteriaceae bacterium]